MALANFSDLKAEVITRSRRGDIANIVDNAIYLAESEMYKHLKLKAMETRATASMDSTTPSRYLALPDDFIEQRTFKITVDDEIYDLTYKPPETMYVRTGTGTPIFFTVTDQLEFDIEPDQDYVITMSYTKELARLSTSNTTNAIMTKFPGIYIQGALWSIFDSVRNEELADYRLGKFMGEIASANSMDRKGRFGVAPYTPPMSATP